MQREEISSNETYDVIVVGGGVGGCIVASRLAQFGVNPRNGEKLKIALLEWGPYHKGEARRGYGTPSRRAAFDGLPYELPRRYMLPWATLGMVGGSTQWAGMIAHPPEPIDFDHWRAETGVNWTWEMFTYPMTELREMWHPYPEPEGVRSPGQKKFKEVALRLGYDVYEAGQAKVNCIRCGDCNGRVCKYDAKSTPLVTYVPIAEREGVRIIPETPVEKVVIEKKGSRPVATGVIYHKDGQLRQARAGKVIVSCGYNGTPRLLYRSGYGPRDKVQGELLAENPNVGKWLVCSINAGGGVQMLFDEPVKYPDVGVHTTLYVRLVGHQGYNHLIIRENFGVREGTGYFPDDFARHRLAPEFGRDFKQFMRIASTHVGQINGGELSKTALRGDIRPDGRARIGGYTGAVGEGEGERVGRGGVAREFLEKSHPEILEMFKEGQQIALRIGKELSKEFKTKRIVAREELPELFGTNHNHGSCRAGASRENSVVNSDFESHDVDNLFVCDASVVPVQCTANPSMPTIALCNHAWRRIVMNHFSRA